MRSKQAGWRQAAKLPPGPALKPERLSAFANGFVEFDF